MFLMIVKFLGIVALVNIIYWAVIATFVWLCTKLMAVVKRDGIESGMTAIAQFGFILSLLIAVVYILM